MTSAHLDSSPVADTPDDEAAAAVPIRAVGRWRLVLRTFAHRPTGMIGLGVLVLLFLAAFAGPHLTQWSYDQPDFENFLSPPSGTHWFGTDQIGDDVFAQTMRGLQKSLIIGLVAGLLGTTIAATVGVAGRLLRRLDRPGHELAHRPAAGDPELPDHRDALAALPGPDLADLHPAARGVQLDDHRADRARHDRVAGEPRVREGRALHGSARAHRHPAPHPAEHQLAADHRRRARRELGGDGRDRPVLPRLRRPAAGRLARHAAGRPARSPRRRSRGCSGSPPACWWSSASRSTWSATACATRSTRPRGPHGDFPPARTGPCHPGWRRPARSSRSATCTCPSAPAPAGPAGPAAPSRWCAGSPSTWRRGEVARHRRRVRLRQVGLRRSRSWGCCRRTRASPAPSGSTAANCSDSDDRELSRPPRPAHRRWSSRTRCRR